jgi:hypothetical protein
VADAGSGLQILDISNPVSPVILGNVDTPGSARAVVVAGAVAYVADWDSGLQVIDISNPTAPTIVGSVDTPGSAGGVAVSGTLVYVADYRGVQIIDVSNLTSPMIVGTVNVIGDTYGVAVDGRTAYVAAGNYGLQVFDVSTPVSPIRLGYAETGAEARALTMSESLIYVVSGGPSSPGSVIRHMMWILLPQCEGTVPVRLSSFTASSENRGILLEWGSSGETDFSGFHVQRSMQSDAAYERITTELIPPKANYKLLDSDVVAGATYYYRLEALDRTGKREFFGPVSARMEPFTRKTQLGQPFPNPVTKGSSTITFTMASSGRVRIRVLDLAGREVRMLLDGPAQAGDQSVIWNGRNERGELVPAGMYLCQLQIPGFQATRKLVRLQ